MLLSRRLLGWTGRRGGRHREDTRAWEAELLAHAEYLDVALHNGVLGTQRGTQPGAMLYMLPLGAGVRKGGGAHGYSNGENHFWCCMGSAIEAFTRLHASVFYRRPRRRPRAPNADGAHPLAPAFGAQGGSAVDGAGSGVVAGVVESGGAQNDASAELYVVQLLPARLIWKEEGCEVMLRSEIPGEIAADRPLSASLEVSTLAGAARACVLQLSVRVPSWAYAAEASLKEDDVVTSVEPAPRPGTLLRYELREGKVLRVRLWARTTLKRADGTEPSPSSSVEPSPNLFEPSRSSSSSSSSKIAAAATARPHVPTTARGWRDGPGVMASRTLAGLMHGPLLLAVLTDGERFVRAPVQWDGSFDPRIPPATARAAAAGRSSAAVAHWTTPVPARARAELHSLALFDPNACAAAAGSGIGGRGGVDGRSGTLATPPLLLTHAGERQRVMLARAPERPPAVAPRQGGSDAVHAATWRITRTPVTAPAAPGAVSGAGVPLPPLDAAAMADRPVAVVLESFDRPGMVLTLASTLASTLPSTRTGPRHRPVHLEPTLPVGRDAMQRWWLRRVPIDGACALSGSSKAAAAALMALESVAEAGVWLVAGETSTGGTGGSRSAHPPATALYAATTTSAAAAHFRLLDPLARYPPLAFWAHSNVSCHAPSADPSASCRQHYLAVPLRDVIDETYSAHLCVLPAGGAEPPTFCRR